MTARMRRLPLAIGVGVGTGVVLASVWARQYYTTLMQHTDYTSKVHKDTSTAHIKVERQVQPKQTVLVLQEKDGSVQKVSADTDKVSNFVRQEVLKLEQSRQQLIQKSTTSLKRNMSEIFESYRARCDRFADWYFSYSTMYKLLSTATSSAVRNTFTLSPSHMSVADAVGHDVVKYLQKKYESIVLRPEVTDPQLRRAYVSSYRETHEQFLSVVSSTQKSFQEFVSKETTHLQAPNEADVSLALDWASQLNKINNVAAAHEKGPEGVAMSAALAMGGAVIGKTVASAAVVTTAKGAGAAAAAGKLGGAAMAGKGVTAVLGKLAAPFVAKAASAGTVLGSGAAAGAVAGPVGGVVGAAAGLGVDYIINRGVELMQRDVFLQDMFEALDSMEAEWESQLEAELHRAVNVWIDDAVQLLLVFDEKNKGGGGAFGVRGWARPRGDEGGAKGLDEGVVHVEEGEVER